MQPDDPATGETRRFNRDDGPPLPAEILTHITITNTGSRRSGMIDPRIRSREALPAIVRRGANRLLDHSGFTPMAAVLTRNPLLAQCLAIPLLGCLVLGTWAAGLPGLIIGVYLVGLAALLGRDSFAELAGNAGLGTTHPQPSFPEPEARH
jgi:hypothetical protein